MRATALGHVRVAVTGMGIVSPVGTGLDNAWEAIVAGRSGIGPLTCFDAADYPVRIAGEAGDFEPRNWLDAREVRRSDRFSQMAVAAAAMAFEQAGWGELPYEPVRVGVYVGSGVGGYITIEETRKTLVTRGPRKVGALSVPTLMINNAPGAIAMRWGLMGPNFSPVSACATGTHAIGEAARLVATGGADAVVAGGAEAAIVPSLMAAFASMGAMARRNDEPQRASRPFDADREGFVIGEGAGIVILESWEAAQRRGATILAEVVGYGASCDAVHMTHPDPEGRGAVLSMRMALEGIDPSSIGYINAHGTSTPLNDRTESKAILDVFGESPPPVSSTKSATGHLLGAAGAIEAIFAMLALRHGVLPPTLNYQTPDPDCPLDYVPNTARKADPEYAISNSFGFGGHNATLTFRRAPA